MDDEELARRLDIFEEQLKKMTEAILTLAIVEERQTFQTQRIDANAKDQDEVFKRLRILETGCTINTTKMGTGERFWWILITALVATLVSILTIKTFGS